MTITTVGIDLAKNVFAVHCVDQNGVLGILPPYIAKPSEAPVCRGL